MGPGVGDGVTRRAPPSLIFNFNRDKEVAFWQCLHERLQKEPEVTLIVHLKRGATYVGKVGYYEPMRLVLHTRTEQVEIWARDVAHIIAAPQLA